MCNICQNNTNTPSTVLNNSIQQQKIKAFLILANRVNSKGRKHLIYKPKGENMYSDSLQRVRQQGKQKRHKYLKAACERDWRWCLLCVILRKNSQKESKKWFKSLVRSSYKTGIKGNLAMKHEMNLLGKSKMKDHKSPSNDGKMRLLKSQSKNKELREKRANMSILR